MTINLTKVSEAKVLKVFRTQSNNYDGSFYENSERLKAVKYFWKKSPL